MIVLRTWSSYCAGASTPRPHSPTAIPSTALPASPVPGQMLCLAAAAAAAAESSADVIAPGDHVSGKPGILILTKL